MRTLGKLGMTLCFAAALSYGNTWTAKIMDASCYANRKTTHEPRGPAAKVCAPTASTTDFAFITTAGKEYGTVGRVYKFDSDSNSKIASDLQSGSLPKAKDGEIHATVTGKVRAGLVDVNSVVVSRYK